jgi:thioredoxin
MMSVYADWCGPCKMIAPHFERLAKEYSEPKRVAFVKVDVDNQQSIARSHGVSAMPTFIIFHCGKAINTIKGANPPALTAAISEALKLKGQGTPGEYFRTPGRTLGGDGQPSTTAPMGMADFQSIINGVILFVGIYIVSLLSARASEWFQGKKEE